MYETCDKNISNEEYENLKETVYAKQRIESNFSWKRALRFDKNATLSGKSALVLSRRAVGSLIPQLEVAFEKFLFFFFKRALFNKALDPGTLYLSKTRPVNKCKRS